MGFRRRRNSYVAGVCGGLEDYTGFPAILWRLLFIFIVPYAFWVYLAFWAFTEEQ
jgi:phage shock protein PspC (stress-responsive transcriptional regulator)